MVVGIPYAVEVAFPYVVVVGHEDDGGVVVVAYHVGDEDAYQGEVVAYLGDENQEVVVQDDEGVVVVDHDASYQDGVVVVHAHSLKMDLSLHGASLAFSFFRYFFFFNFILV